MPRENWLVIGISGATCSGKTTIAKELHSLFGNSVLLQQDDYFYDEKIIESSNSTTTTQCKSTEIEIKFKEKFCSTDVIPSVYCIINKFQKLQLVPNILFIEGFLIFNDDQLQDLCDLKFYFTMSKTLCFERRKTRIYKPPDVPGYFEKYVWPLYLIHYDEVLRKCTNVTYLDGSDSIENNFRSILHRILDFLI
ncbi:Nicotinamide riboside kinase, putative [Pediculus humanus corporis]|uniref:Nicotinamide riboside kinase, putative n=1 Tax=Pediculus humanus subsp. corporis TaxID=121224 RepID=E0VD59_PEDHC|nr:Nicotinamide riboside kinase, putative [Pediculus humanus corporis]EEB11315.1 Nicotinamide riboside kinase, putative [Pediculus humanus corporis]